MAIEIRDKLRKLFRSLEGDLKDLKELYIDLGIEEGKQDKIQEILSFLESIRMDDRPEIEEFLRSSEYTAGWNDCINKIQENL